jgi:hypothetical protein
VPIPAATGPSSNTSGGSLDDQFSSHLADESSRDGLTR